MSTDPSTPEWLEGELEDLGGDELEGDVPMTGGDPDELEPEDYEDQGAKPRYPDLLDSDERHLFGNGRYSTIYFEPDEEGTATFEVALEIFQSWSE